jgi:hypothetical protein
LMFFLKQVDRCEDARNVTEMLRIIPHQFFDGDAGESSLGRIVEEQSHDFVSGSSM